MIMKLKYQVFGADASTGEERRIVVDADNREEAARIANEQGVYVASLAVWVDPPPSPAPSVPLRPRLSSQTQATLFAIAVMAGGFLIIVLICAGIFHTSPAEKEKAKEDNDKAMAITMAQGFVKERLKSPSSASFPWDFGEYHVFSSDGVEWSVSGYVDGQNSFGATLRNQWSVEMKRVPNGGWQLKTIDIHE